MCNKVNLSQAPAEVKKGTGRAQLFSSKLEVLRHPIKIESSFLNVCKAYIWEIIKYEPWEQTTFLVPNTVVVKKRFSTWSALVATNKQQVGHILTKLTHTET